MRTEQYVLTAVLGVVAGGAGIGSWFTWKRRRLIVDTRTSPIGSCRGGFAELKGAVVAIDTVTAPFSEKPCVYCEYKVEEYRSRGKHGSWITLRRNREMVDFLLDDGSGRALVRLREAELSLTRDAAGGSGTFDNPTPRETAFLQRLGIDPQGTFGFNRPLRYSETILEAGDELYVLGSVRPVERRDAVAADLGARLVVEKRTGSELFVSDSSEEQLLASMLTTTIAWAAGTLLALGGIVALWMYA
ncbi:MAG: hypothetical protein HZA54_05815 [Planctomycetes bacterium]|nr:hypothetical protein [Planctomycetota bacterium]